MICKNIMIVGVGGQGTLLTSCTFGKLATGAGYDVRLSEAHGMIQRGGSVATFVRYGEKVSEPIVEKGQADALIVFERLEALRYLHFLKKDGVVIVSNWRIDPVIAVTGVASYPEDVLDISKEMHKTIVVEVTAEAKKLGAPKTFNIIVLGTAARYMGFEKQDRLSAIGTTVLPETIEVNKQIFEVGYALSLQEGLLQIRRAYSQMIWSETKGCMNRDEMTNLRSARLIKLVDKVYHNVEYYRKKTQAVSLEPGDTKGIEDLDKLPFITKDDLRDTYPLSMFAVPNSQITRIHASSSTTGKATVVGYIHKDVDVWSECVTRCITMADLGRDDIIQAAYGYGLFTDGLGVHHGVEEMGTTVVPIPAGNTKKLVTMMVDLGVTGIICIPSYLLHIAETIGEMGVRGQIRPKVLTNGVEPWIDKMRAQIERQLGTHARDIYDLSEIMGPGVATDCQYHTGLHIREDHFLPEIMDQHTSEPLWDGMEGELVISMLTKEGLPPIRHRIKDLTSLEHGPCECGRTAARIVRFTGRTDDMLIIRGVNVFPSQIKSALLEMGGTIPHYLPIVDRINNLDTLEVQVKVEERFFSDEIRELENLTGRITHVTQEVIGLAVKVKLVGLKSTERSMGKTKRVINKRTLI